VEIISKQPMGGDAQLEYGENCSGGDVPEWPGWIGDFFRGGNLGNVRRECLGWKSG